MERRRRSRGSEMTTRTEEGSCGANGWALFTIQDQPGREETVCVLSSTVGQRVCRCYDTGNLQSVSCPGGKGRLIYSASQMCVL